MTRLRKFIIRQFALNYTFKLFNRYWTALRVSRYIFPTFVSTGLTITYTGWNVLSVTLSLFTLVFVYFGFLHFEFFPITKDEYKYLDEDQKRQVDYFNEKYK